MKMVNEEVEALDALEKEASEFNKACNLTLLPTTRFD